MAQIKFCGSLLQDTENPEKKINGVWILSAVGFTVTANFLMYLCNLRTAKFAAIPFTFFTIEDYVKQVQAGLLAPGSSYWPPLPRTPFEQFEPFKRLFQWFCGFRSRLQRRVRSSSHFYNNITRLWIPF